MANYTPNYRLHQWEPEDPFLRTDFNEDLAKIDQALQASGDCHFIYGSYVGTGTFGTSAPCTLDFSDILPETPKMLLVRRSIGTYNYLLVLRGMESTFLSSENTYSNEVAHFTWKDTSVSWYVEKNETLQMNLEGETYYYIAMA